MAAAEEITAGKLYTLCMEAKPSGGVWFSMQARCAILNTPA